MDPAVRVFSQLAARGDANSDGQNSPGGRRGSKNPWIFAGGVYVPCALAATVKSCGLRNPEVERECVRWIQGMVGDECHV